MEHFAQSRYSSRHMITRVKLTKSCSICAYHINEKSH